MWMIAATMLPVMPSVVMTDVQAGSHTPSLPTITLKPALLVAPEEGIGAMQPRLAEQ